MAIRALLGGKSSTRLDGGATHRAISKMVRRTHPPYIPDWLGILIYSAYARLTQPPPTPPW